MQTNRLITLLFSFSTTPLLQHRPFSKRIINYMQISLVLICMQIVLLVVNNKRGVDYSSVFSGDSKQPPQMTAALSLPYLLAIAFYYLLQVLFNLLLIESIRIYCNYLLNKRTLKSRGYLYYSGVDQQLDAKLLRYIRWSRSRYLTHGLAYLVPLFACCLILLFVEDSLKFFIASLLLLEQPPVGALATGSPTGNLFAITQTPEDNYPQLGLLILCFAFTYFVLFLSILLIFIAAKGCWRLQQNGTAGKLNESAHKFGSTSSYSNTLSTSNYNQLTLNSLKPPGGGGTSGPQIPQINTLSAINSTIDNSLCSGQLDPGYLLTSYTKRSTMKLLIIVLIGQTFCWSIWLALCQLNSRYNAHLHYHQFNEPADQHFSLSGLLQVLVVLFSCLNIAQSLFVLASAFHRNHKINSSTIDPTDRNLFGSKIHFGLQWLPICVRKTGASPLPLIGGNQLNNSALNSAASSIQQSQLMIQPANSAAGQQPVYFYSLDANQLNSQLNGNQSNFGAQMSTQNAQPPSPIIKMSSNFPHHTMMMNRNNANNYLSRDASTLCRQPARYNDYLLATSTNQRPLNNGKLQQNLVPFLIPQQQPPKSRPQSYASSNCAPRYGDVHPYAPPVPINDHRLSEQLIGHHQLSDDQADYEEVLPNFGYLNSSIVQPGQASQTNSILLNAASSTMLNRHPQATAMRLANGAAGCPKLNGENSTNSFNSLHQFVSNYGANGQPASSNHQQQVNVQQQFETEQDIYESVEPPCIGYTR